MQSKLFRRFQLTLTFVLFAIGFILACSPMDAIAAHENLLKNPGAETGNLTGWKKGTGSWDGSLSASWTMGGTKAEPLSGSRLFSVRGRKGTKAPHIYQEVDISKYATMLESGITMTAEVWANRADSRDNLRLDIHFLDKSDKRIGKALVKSAANKNVWQILKHDAVAVPETTRKIRFFLVGTISRNSYTTDAYFDDASLTLTLPHLSVDRTTPDFGNLYQNLNATAKAYNDKYSQKIRITNDGNGPDLEWDVTVPSNNTNIVSLSPKTGKITSGRSQNLTVKLNPSISFTSRASYKLYSSFISIKSNVKEQLIKLSASAYNTPTTRVTETTPPRINGTVHIALNDKKQPVFKVSSDKPMFPKASITGYQWQTVVKGQAPTDGSWKDGPKSGDRKIDFVDSTGEFTVYARMMDSNGVGSRHVKIPVHVWNRPTVNKVPPKTVSWFKGKYAGVVGQALKVQASGTTDSGSKITEFHWYQNKTDTEPFVIQKNNQTAVYTPDKQNLSGNLFVEAVTDKGVKSEKKAFPLIVYPDVAVDAGGPYSGVPNSPVPLSGTVNTNGFPGATFDFQWTAAENTISGKQIDHTWGAILENGTIDLDVTVTTREGLTLTGTDSASVTIDAQIPKALPGGPYRGGIAGGNFSPIQFLGDGTVADGTITDFQWTFGPKETGILFDGINDGVTGQGDYVQVPTFELGDDMTVVVWVKAEDISKTWARIIDFGDGANQDNVVLTFNRSTGRLQWNVRRTDNERNESISTSDVFPENAWVHVAVTQAGETATMYWDGDLKASGTVVAPALMARTNQYIGISNFGDKEHFKGKMDDFAIFDRALSQDEIIKIMNNSLIGNEPGLVVYYPMDEGGGDITTDLSGQGRNGKIKGNAERFSEIPASDFANATHAYPTAGAFHARLSVGASTTKWSPPATTTVTVIDGRMEGRVKAADLRTPVELVTQTLTSSGVDPNVLDNIATVDPNLSTDGKSGIVAVTDAGGFYRIEHLPLGDYTVIASKIDGSTIHEFETAKQSIELTLSAPTQLAVDYVDLSVYPIGGRVIYSKQKNGVDVLVEDVTVIAQPVSTISDIKSIPSTKSGSATGSNYNLPLFAGKYLFLAEKFGDIIRIDQNTPGYDPDAQLVTIESARNDIDFVNTTTRELTVIVQDSGKFPFPGKPITVSGDNGQADESNATDETDTDTDGKFVLSLNPGKYTVTIPGALTDDGDESESVDLSAGDQTIIMTIPVPIELQIGPAPKLFGTSAEFEKAFSELATNNPEGFMFYNPPQPLKHEYTITATANGNPVENFMLRVTDEVSQLTANPPEQLNIPVTGVEGSYEITAGKPRLDFSVDPKIPVAGAKTVRFVAQKQGYLDSVPDVQSVTVLGFSPVGDAQRTVSIPVVNYLVLHDPPGDSSYAYFDDALTVSGVISEMSIKAKDGTDIPVYPAPWSVERQVNGSNISGPDLEQEGLLGQNTPGKAGDTFGIVNGIEAGIAAAALVTAGLPPPAPGHVIAYAGLLAKHGITAGTISAGEGIYGQPMVQYSISPFRHLETPSGDELVDLVGPGKGDVYFGEGWTLGLQKQFLLGIKKNPNFDSDDPNSPKWIPSTPNPIVTYDILERSNQYMYTIRDIENLIVDLEVAIKGIPDDKKDPRAAERVELVSAKQTWETLLKNNLAYLWQKELRKPADERQWASFEEFRLAQNLPSDESGNVETLIFSAGPAFEYSRTIAESNTMSFSTGVALDNGADLGGELSLGYEAKLFGGVFEAVISTGISWSVGTSHAIGTEVESGQEVEQTVGFVLQDDDIGDNITTRVYEDPTYGTPLFFADAGSVTSDPWEPGTNKAIDLAFNLIEQPTGVSDYHDGAHYKVQVQYTGQRELETNWIDFVIYDVWTDNSDQMTVRFNGQSGPYDFSLSKSAPETSFVISLYPPEKDRGQSKNKEYSVLIEADETADAYQINRTITLKPTFADLSAPRAVITSPYDGQRISPTLFATDAFKVQVVSEDSNLQKIQLQIRAKQPDGVWEPWRELSGMTWEDGGTNANATVSDRKEQKPLGREFTFSWVEKEIRSLGVGEYQLRAVAIDKANTPNVDIDSPMITFLVDDSPPTVLTSTPFYQDTESKRLYRGELSATFTDDMRHNDFSDRSFEVTDLLNNSQTVAGFVSYSPALRKAVFVPVTPFQPNGFYKAVVKTDSDDGSGAIDRGVRDMAGNPLDQEFSWTFRTTDTPFEEKWSIALSATDGSGTDARNIAAIAFGAEDGEDAKDARAVPRLNSQIGLSFLNQDRVEFDHDTRPADARLGHHWFFAVDNAKPGATVQLQWLPSQKLISTLRQYQFINLITFDSQGKVTDTIPLDPTGIDPYGAPVRIHSYAASEEPQLFRLDVMKANMVATTFTPGSSGWKFFSVPIKPQRSDPFVNLGDDIEPFQMLKYDPKNGGYQIYPLDLGEVSLQSGQGYFIRLNADVEVDVGGASNTTDQSLTLGVAGWHAIGNPFVLPVKVSDLKIGGKTFAQAANDGDISGTLYRLKLDAENADAYQPVTQEDTLTPWEGYFIKTLKAKLDLTFLAPAGIGNAVIDLPASFKPPVATPIDSSIVPLVDSSVTIPVAASVAPPDAPPAPPPIKRQAEEVKEESDWSWLDSQNYAF